MRVSISVRLRVVVPFIATVNCTRDNNSIISACTWAPSSGGSRNSARGGGGGPI